MKQKQKFPNGHSKRKVITYLTFAAVISATTLSLGCSSDDEYESLGTIREVKTRAISNVPSRNEGPIDIRGKKIKAGGATLILDGNPQCEVDVYWSAGWVNGSPTQYPKSTISASGGRVCEGATAFFSIPSYNLQWEGQNSSIFGNMSVTGIYIPPHYHTHWYFAYEESVSQIVSVELDTSN